jgi:hypothetical protein
MTPAPEHHVLARLLADKGYRVILGRGKDGLWVRNPDMTRPPFTDANSFISFAKAKVLFITQERNV